MTAMGFRDFLVVLGSAAEDGEEQIATACDRLRQSHSIQSSSRVIRGPSVTDGDPNLYTNQAIRLRTPLERPAFEIVLKQCEEQLGRDAAHRGLIDLDLAREYDAQGRLCWENPAKLAHPLFRDLAAEVEPGAASAIPMSDHDPA